MNEGQGKAWAIVVAAGEGTRMRGGAYASGPRKPFIELAGKPMLLWTLEAVAACPRVERTVVAVAERDIDAAETLITPHRERLRVAAVVGGGKRRQDSVARALEAVPEDVELVAVHDGARPLVSPKLVGCVIEGAHWARSAVAALPVVDTLKRTRPDLGSHRISGTVDRSNLWAVQTPQVSHASALRGLLAEAERDGVTVTDEAGLLERAGLPVEIVRGESTNIKITTPEDVAFAEAVLAGRARGDGGEASGPLRQAARRGGGEGGAMRVGSGYDIHPLAPGRRLVVCGVELDSPAGAEGHSDADAAAHAVIDALLGACALGDIGRLFPDTDPAYRDADSMTLVAEAASLVRSAGYEPRSVDVTVFLEKPAIGSLAVRMRKQLCDATGLLPRDVSVKAKTMNGLGPVGEGKAYAAQAVAVVAPCGRAGAEAAVKKS